METKKQIENQLRNKIAKQYTSRIKNLEERNRQLYSDYQNAIKRAQEAEYKLGELQDKITQYEDWIERLQEFCNMSEEDRNVAIEELKRKKQLNSTMEFVANSSFWKMFSHLGLF